MQIKKEFVAIILAVGIQSEIICALQENVKSKPPTSGEKNEGKKVYTNEDLERISRPGEKEPDSGSHSNPKLTPAAPGRGKSRQIDLDNYVDRYGHGREYWHKQSQSLRDKLEIVGREIESLEKQKKDLSEARGIRVTRRGGLQTSGDISRIQSRLASSQREKSQLQRQIEHLEEEARKAGALPEWLR